MRKSILLMLLMALPFFNLYAQNDTSGAGYALNFRGVRGNYVNAGKNLQTLKFPFTFEAWIELTKHIRPQVSIFSSDDSYNYNGFWINIDKKGFLSLEFGDGLGGNYYDRRGVVGKKMTALPIQKWVHIAAVCKSVSDISIYFNGIKQPTQSSGGASRDTILEHDTGSARIGDISDISGEYPLDGQIDEVRIWDTARTEKQIRDNMCNRIIPVPSLFAYWRCEGSMNDNNIKDYALKPHPAKIIGHVNKLASGAPVGDLSNDYYGNFSGKTLLLDDPSGDTFKVQNVTGSPQGVIIYAADESPFNAQGLEAYPSHYFGVFCADKDSVASYSAIYKYANATAAGKIKEKINLFTKETDHDSLWTNSGAERDTGANKIVLSGATNRGEYILDFISDFSKQTLMSTEINSSLSTFPNPATNQLTLLLPENTAGEILITNVLGQIVYSKKLTSNASKEYSLSISDLSKGIYIISLNTPEGMFESKFVKE
jgi:hypothetical protein